MVEKKRGYPIRIRDYLKSKIMTPLEFLRQEDKFGDEKYHGSFVFGTVRYPEDTVVQAMIDYNLFMFKNEARLLIRAFERTNDKNFDMDVFLKEYFNNKTQTQ